MEGISDLTYRTQANAMGSISLVAHSTKGRAAEHYCVLIYGGETTSYYHTITRQVSMAPHEAQYWTPVSSLALLLMPRSSVMLCDIRDGHEPNCHGSSHASTNCPGKTHTWNDAVTVSPPYPPALLSRRHSELFHAAQKTRSHTNDSSLPRRIQVCAIHAGLKTAG